MTKEMTLRYGTNPHQNPARVYIKTGELPITVLSGSDAFFPFRDSIDRAAMSGVRYMLQPGGSTRDADVIGACDEYGMTMVFSGVRLFHH